MKNCLQGGKLQDTIMRVQIKQPSEVRIRKLLAKKAKKAKKYGISK